MDGLSGAEKEALKKSLAELINDAPTIEAASLRIKKLLLKVGQAGADALRNLLIDVLSETAKKSMGL